MRLIFGMILGAAVTIGVAYMHDSYYVKNSPDASVAEQRPMVNWDVACAFARRTSSAARQQWDKLVK